MMRNFMIAALALLLSGCWESEEQLFTSADFAPQDVAAQYQFQGYDSKSIDVTATALPGNMVRFDNPEEPDDPMIFGLVPVAKGKRDNFLLVREAEDGDGWEYMLARGTLPSSLEVYQPACKGTPDIAGMERDGSICRFSTREALLEAGRAAAQYLDEPQIIMTAPMIMFTAKRAVPVPSEPAG